MPDGPVDKLGRLGEAAGQGLGGALRGIGRAVLWLLLALLKGVRLLARQARRGWTPIERFFDAHQRVVNPLISILLIGVLLWGAGYGVWWLMFRTTTSPRPPEGGVPRSAHAFADTHTLPSFAADLASLTRWPHRLAGSENGHAAAALVEQRLRAILEAPDDGSAGLDQVFVQRFPVVAGQYEDVTIRVDGGEPQPLYACRANLLAGSITPAEGLSGRTIYAGSGSLLDYGVGDPRDKIVVLDFDGGVWHWPAVFAMGAKAVLFVGDGIAPVAWHHINIPAILPRFYLPAAQADALGLREGSREVTLTSRMRWVNAEGRNIIGVIRGRQPVFDANKPAEALLLAAPLDSYGEVPDLSPGARGAANMAALLGIAEYLMARGPAKLEAADVLDWSALAEALQDRAAAAPADSAGGRLWAEFTSQARQAVGQLVEPAEPEALDAAKEQVLAALNAAVTAAGFYRAGDLAEATLEWRDARLISADPASLDEEQRARLNRLTLQSLLPDEIARQNDNRPRRDIILCFFDGQAMYNAGARAFYSALFRKDKDTPLADALTVQAERLKAERAYLQGVQNSLKAVLGTRSLPADNEAFKALRNTARFLNDDKSEQAQSTRSDLLYVIDRLEALRNRLGEVRQAVETEVPAAEGRVSVAPRAALEREQASLTAQIDQLEKQRQVLDERLEMDVAVKQEWGNLQREINTGDIQPATAEVYRQAVEQAVADAQRRLGEIDRENLHNDDAQQLEKALGGDFIVLHLNVDFAESRTRWTVVHGDRVRPDDITDDRTPAYGKTIFRPIRNALDTMKAAGLDGAPGFDTKAISGMMENPSAYDPTVRADSGAVARLFGVYNIAAVTAFDRTDRDGQPGDTLAAMNGQEGNIGVQALQLARLTGSLGDSPELSVSRQTAVSASYQQVRWSRTNITGPTAIMQSAASAVANRPAAGGIVAVMPQGQAKDWSKSTVLWCAPGFEHNLFAAIDSNGRFGFGPVNKVFFATSNYVATMFDERGVPSHIANAETVSQKLDSIGVKLFRAKTIACVGRGWYRGATPTQVLRAKSTAAFRRDLSLIAEDEMAVAVYVRPEVRGLKLFNPSGFAILNNQVGLGKEAGVGVPFDTPFDFVETSEQSAYDRWRLNQTRLTLLRDNHITESSLQKYHTQAKIILDQVREAPPDTLLAKQQGDLQAADAINRRVYAPLLTVLNDLVVAVVFLLLLAMPFAYALERLAIGTPHIYRQIGYVTLFFLLTFVVLYFVNPAFRIAATPIIIFLAFAVIVLSGVVIFIMTRKLQVEVKRMQGLGTTVHSSDVSRLSTMMAAVNMGISTMRRRPIRTILTAVTVVLLTFTILTFASFSNTWGTRRTYSGSLRGPVRVMVRQTLWSPIEDDIIEMYRGRMLGRGEIVPRWWVSPTAGEADAVKLNKRPPFSYAVATADGTKVVEIRALVGMDPADVAYNSGLRDLFADGGEALKADGVYLTPSVAVNELGLKVGDKVLVAGIEMTLAGLLSPEQLTSYTQLEGSSLLPADYQSSQGTGTGAFVDSASMSEMPDIESASFVTFSPDNVAFISPEAARRLDGRVRSFQIFPKDPELLAELGEEAARLSGMPSYVGDTDGVYRLYFTTLTQASGFRDLVIPVILGGLIVFATMLGSVSDREREIYTFSALGLAPPHVASLFFAEASVYAVVGGMGGYLLGQTVGRVLGWMANMGWMDVPPMNYSSSNAIVTVLIVMGTVLISTIYPAIKASRSANPGVARSWRIGRPKGDLYDIVFPFTVSSYDITGVVSFLKEHFDNYGDTSLGIFATETAGVFRQKPQDGEELLGFEASVALAPFDLGVTQDFTLLSQPSEIAGIDEVRILLKRKSGSPGDWRRANRVFVSDLRRQLLIWRALPTEVMEKYRQQTLERWDSLPVGSSLLEAEVAK